MPMNIRTALLPHKHVRFSESIVALAGLVRKLLTEPRTIDELWAVIEQNATDWPSRPSFAELLFAADVLFAIRQIAVANDGRLRRLTASSISLESLDEAH
jgi:hypothetical protein